MKKRKELNALIGLAADGRRKKPAKKGSGHRLLRTEPPASDSESSSEEDEFAGARGRCGKGDYLRCCKFCYPLCAFVILAACVVACVGLVWMQVALKEDLDAIKEKFRTMESNQKTSFQEIPKLNEDLVQKQKQLEQIETGELGLNKIWINITEINKQISLLTSTVNHLKNNIKSASDLISLPLTVEKLQKTVANIGSTLTSVSHDVENIQTAIEEYKKSIEILQNDVKELKQIPSLPSTIVPRTERNQTENCKKVFFSLARGILLQVSLESQSLHAALEELNNTVVAYQKLNDIKLLNVDSAIGNLSRRVMLLENSPLAVNNLDKRENLSTNVANDATTSLKVENEDQLDNETHSNKELKETGPRDSQVSKLKEKLQLISALTGKPENDKPIETSKNVESSLSTTAKPTDLSRLASRSADDITESNGQLRHLSLPGISSIRDLQNLFEKATEDTGGKLSYEDLQKLLGSTAQESQSFKKFDTDGDEKYSLQELRLALGI
ncbi:EF-hand calcium-binding domain-containing protein 14 isoform X1 [Accipiter gentilis]|uniref:EF-hand calcium-binding domain-containing protein 14 isoform X1 n=1 Tax=Astur gentilis TaxID=8957 RepID=UPI00210F6BA0|nr:EF-hand calcium-binding domain-containing protein 14 isoform X1 [Accipiter gentilis]